MTDETKALDECIAKVLGWRDGLPDDAVGWWAPSGPGVETLRDHPSSDWNAIHAAMERLEEQGWYFEREDYVWHVYHGSKRGAISVAHDFGDNPAQEHIAAAKCIQAVESEHE